MSDLIPAANEPAELLPLITELCQDMLPALQSLAGK
jgi:hypothetical protein